jgi:DNA modification methylase
MPNNNLFDTDTLYSATPLGAKASAPVRCLGKDFKNEEERRAFFCDELRKQLPELRKLEGFPIGEDEDIIALSDPPFYTSCPNPWLNDFIAEWEEEKKVLVAKKKRKEGHEVHEPYASDVSEGKNNPIYNAHSYHTKVPHPAIMRYILHYTQPGDIVYDGFAGTGMTGVAAQLCDNPDLGLKTRIESEFINLGLKKPIWGARKAICGDLSPIASFIAYNYNTPVDVAAFEHESQRILSEIESECGWMYETHHVDNSVGSINFTIWSDVFICPNCGGEIVFWDAAIEKNTGVILDDFPCPHCDLMVSKDPASPNSKSESQQKRPKSKKLTNAKITVFDRDLDQPIICNLSVPVLINYTVKNKRYEKSPDTKDLALLKKIDSFNIPSWYPIERMPEGDEARRNDDAGVTHVHRFHIRSCLAGLAAFWQKALAVPDGRTRGSLLLAASAANPNFSKLRRFRADKKGGGPLAGTLYIASLITPQNPIDSIRRNVEFVRKAFSSAGFRNQNALTVVASATQLLQEPNSVDYIFTDPPFGSNIMYSELNFLWESWLKVKTNNKPEAVEDSVQGKTLFDYQRLMERCFLEYCRVLKPGRWMTVEFSNTSAAVWNGIQAAIQRAGFVIANVAALDKQQGSFKAVTTPTAVNQDLVISCYKPSSDFDLKFRTASTDVSVWAFVEEHLRHLPVCMLKEKTTTAVIERSPKILYDRLISFFLMRGLPIPIDAADFHASLRAKFLERDGMIFLSEQAAEYEEQKRKLGITKQIDFVFDVIYSESDALAWLKDRLAKKPQKYQDIQPEFLKANAATRKGEKEIELKTLLDENFIELADSRYRCPDPSEEKDREALRTKALLKEFSHYLESANDPKTKKLKELRVEALRAGFKACWEKKDFASIVVLGEKMPQNLLLEDEQLLMFYDIAKDRA